MANFGKLLLTNVGLQEQAKAQSGSPLKFKRIGMGSGKYSGNIAALTSLVSENVSVAISKGYVQNGAGVVEGFFSNEGLQTGFAWREIGVFVEDSNGNEVLYCYANAGDTYDYIPATADERYSKYIRVAMAIGNATNISIVESEGIIYVDKRTFDTAILELQTDVDQLWPSKSASGSVIVAEGSANLPLVGLNIYGKSEQIKTTGAQLISRPYAYVDSNQGGVDFKVNDDGSVSVSGTAEGNIYFALNGGFAQAAVKIPDWLTEGSKFTISGGRADIGISLFLYPASEGDPVAFTAYGSSKTITIPSGYDYYGIFIQVPVGKTVNGTVYPMINEGDSALEYEIYTGGAPSPSPEYPQEIVSIKKPTVSVCGKNILKPSGTKTQNGVTLTLNEDGTYTLSGTATGYANLNIGNAFVVAGRKYKPTVVVYSGSVNPAYWNFETQSNMNKDGKGYLSTPVDTMMSAFIYNDTAGVTFNARFAVMIELVTDNETGIYEPYKEEQTLALALNSLIDLGQGVLFGIPVSSGGNYTDENGQSWYCDEADFERGVFISRIGTKIFDGSSDEAWYLSDMWYHTSIADKRNNRTSVENALICSHFMVDKYTSHKIGYISETYYVKGNTNILINYDNGEGGVDNFKTWLQSNPITVKYLRATPIEIPLSASEIAAYEALYSNNPTTTVFNDVGAEMSVRCITKVQEPVIKKVISKIISLEGATNDRLYGGGTVGLDYEFAEGAYACSVGRATEEEHIIIPSKVLGIPVTSIAKNGFSDTAWDNRFIKAKSIYIPKSIILIGELAFNGSGITDVYYEGTEEEWNAFAGATLITATKHFNS